MASLRGGVQLPVLLVVIAVLGCGTAQFQTCYDSANCGGNVVTGVITAQDCCLGDGYSFQISGQCVQCIVHGFERTAVSVDEGAMQETLRVSLDIKGNTLDEPANVRVSTIDLTLMCQDMTTESDDYSTTACGTLIELDRGDPAHLSSEVLITFLADNNALESTEDLSLRLVNTQNEVTTAGNIFFQNTSIQIRDTTVLRSGFEEQDHSGREGLDRRSTLPGIPCTVVIRLQGTTIEHDLTFRLTPRTVSENINMGGPPPTGELRNANASRMDFNDTQPFEVTMAAGTEAVRADIPIVDDEINESTEDFVVVLEVVSNTTNPVEFTIQTTICRIPGNDPIEIGFTQARVEHNETQRQFITSLEKDRQSEQTFVVRIQISTPSIRGVGEPATPERTSPQVPPNPLADFRLGNRLLVTVRLSPDDNQTVFQYTIFEDNTPENTEIFQLSADPDPFTANNPDFDCDDDPMFQFNGRDCFPDLQILILDDDMVVIGFVETLVEVDECNGRATLNVSISFPAPDPFLGFQIMFRLDATMMNITAGARPASAGRLDPIIPGLHDYQEIAPGSVLPHDFEDTRRSQTFGVGIYLDDVPEGVEELNITLSLQDPRLSDRVMVHPAVATVRIRDNDGATCYDNAAENCGGNVIPCVSIRDCCLGDGFWVNQTNGECVQCIVHGFENTSVMVDEGDLQVALAIRLDIKGNTTNERRPVTNINFTVTFTDISTEQDDYNVIDYNSFIQLCIPENMTSQVLINFPHDNNALEGIERLILKLQLSASTQDEVTDAGNIFFQDTTSIEIHDTTALRLGFEEEEYSGSEGSTNVPCRVVVHLQNTTTEAPLTLRLIPRTIPDIVAVSGPLPTSTLRGTNASRMDFNVTPFEVTMEAGTTSVTANIPIVDDEINEAEEEFVVVLEVVSVTTNTEEFTTNPTVCRISPSDSIEIGFRQARVDHSENETEAIYMAVLEKNRPSEQTFLIEILISTPYILGLGEPATPGDDFQVSNVSIVTLTPDDNQTEIPYQIVGDEIPERTEIFLVSSRTISNSTAFDCDGLQDCFPELQVLVRDDDDVMVGFVETLIEVNETDGTATLNVSIRSPPSDVAFGFEIILLVNTVDGSARSSCSVSDTNTGSDFLGISQSLQFVDAHQSQTVTVTITDDNVTEGVEELTVRLSLQDMELATSVIVTPAVATVRILDDDSPAQFKMCYDNAATDCNGTAVLNVSTARECCLGDGFWFDDEDGRCHQCIVHGFVNTRVMVNESSRQIIQIRQNIKGSTNAEQSLVNRIGVTLRCNNMSTEQDDYNTIACNSAGRLDQNDTIQVAIDFPRDNVALEGTEELLMELQLSQEQESTFITTGNIFIHNVSVIQIHDITNITLGFLQEAYDGGNEGSDELPYMPCRVNISLHNTTIEAPLTLRLIPQTIPEYVAANGSLPTVRLRGANASRMDFNDTQPFEVTMEAGTMVVPAEIPIFNDEINEAEEEFVVVLEVVSNTTNSVELTTNIAVCRILASDPIDIGFTQARVEHNESEANFSAVIRKSRQSEQTFDIQINSTAQTSPATQGPGSEEVPNPDFVVSTTSATMAPEQNESVILYQIFEDIIPENTEIFQLSAAVSNPTGTPDDPTFRFNGSDYFSALQVQILDDDFLGTIGFMETLIDVNESIGEATLNVSLTLNSSIQFEIMFSLFANTMNGSTAGIEDYQQIENMSLDFNNTERSQTFSLTIYEDDIPEGVEELNVTLSLQDPNLANQVIVEPAVATVRILDNDSVVVGFNETTYTVNEMDEQVELCVIISVPEDQNIGDVTFSLAVETNGTAMSSGTVGSGMMGSGMMGSGAEYDYMSVMTTLATFTMEQPTQCFNVTIVDDTEVETTEHFIARLTLTSVTTIDSNRITVAPAETTVNIMDNDGLITVGYTETAVTISERAGVAQLHVSISVPDTSVTIDNSVSFYLLVNISNTTATADFCLGPFSNDVRELSFNVSIEDDMIPEENEEFTATLTLSPADQARFGNLVRVAPDLATITIMDDDGMTAVPSATSASLLGSAIPSPSTSPTSSPIASANLWLLFVPLAVVLLVLLIVAVAAIVYYKQRRTKLNLKPGPGKGSPEDDKGIETAHPLASHRPSVQLRRMLPHRMIIPSSVLKLQDSIGQGEFGVVYKARLQWHLDAATEVVAVKTLKGLFTPNDVDNLVQEVLKMHTLSHPNVMSLTGVCLDSGGGPAVVMPFMGNGSVLNYLKKGRGKLVPRDDADCSVISDAQTQLLGMCLQISKGMEYLANERIVHRDLAARNCMMDVSGVIKVADFGLSEDIYTSTYYRRRKSDTAVKLPVKWMAPESTSDGIFTEKSDVWSFGVTCWEVFTGGHIPYSGISPVALLQLLRNGERLNKPINPACSDEIYAVMLDCWKEEPKERPNFSKLVNTISLTLESAAGYMDFSMSIKDEHPVAAEVEVKTRGGGSSVQSQSEEGGQQETAV